MSEGPLAMTHAEIDRHAPYVMAIGPRPDVPALLGLADAFVFPTEYREGIPRALLEVGLAVLPIVTTKMTGCSDVVRDGWNGFLRAHRMPWRQEFSICYATGRLRRRWAAEVRIS